MLSKFSRQIDSNMTLNYLTVTYTEACTNVSKAIEDTNFATSKSGLLLWDG